MCAAASDKIYYIYTVFFERLFDYNITVTGSPIEA